MTGFTPAQLERLREQITAFKKLKKNELDFPIPGLPNVIAREHVAQRAKMLAMQRENAAAASAPQAQARGGGPVGLPGRAVANAHPVALPGKVVASGGSGGRGGGGGGGGGGAPSKRSHRGGGQGGPPPLPPVMHRPMPKPVTSMPAWWKPRERPIYDLAADAASGPGGDQYGYKPAPMRRDLRALVEAEADRALRARRERRLVEIKEELRELAGGGGGGGKSHQARRALQLEERSLRLVGLQDKVRASLVREQRELMSMGERPYKKLVRELEKQREVSAKAEVKRAREEREAHFKAMKARRQVIFEESGVARDLCVTRNRQILKVHERMSKDWARRQRDVQNAANQALAAAGANAAGAGNAGGAASNADYLKRVEALKANDMEAYRELLAEARGREGAIGAGDGDAGDDKFAALQEFLEKTEGYLEQLGGKIAALKLDQQRSEAAAAAAAEAEAQGMTEEEVIEFATRAADKAAADGGRNLLEAASAGDGGDSKQKYYALAHTETEKIIRQPRMLTAGSLRDYQLVSLQWMISLYNNKLNGILADEMGLGKTVQVCALIAYLWESKQNYGPHLIIVPNAVIVNWKSEIKTWLKNVQAVYYVGGREQRQKIFTQQVLQLKFNVLVTTYEFVMRDRAKLSKVNWKYIIIDEAQRLKDREGRLSRDLDRFRCMRRLLLTGTPLQNDLSELWSLLNLLLPQVFDNARMFQQWFGDSGNSKKAAAMPDGDGGEIDWIEKEKKIIIISRLHQILEPFMLRRLVQDVESKLPAKHTIVVHCPMSAYQAAVYDWVSKTSTVRMEPNARIGLAARANFRGYLPLQNRCMELRKLCNHPALNYPIAKGGEWRSGPDLVRAGGKLWVLDRVLVKLRASGHRVLLFSTMTKLLDLLEDYLKWRASTPICEGLEWCRIDGTTPLDEREVAITQFNERDSKKFLFLLSIRAAGRGLNLQTADTVVVYDPDPNPKNEEQAVARSHRIGQKREVKVMHFEAVVDAIGGANDEGGVGGGPLAPAAAAAAPSTDAPAASSPGTCGLDDTTWGTGGERTYTESVESVVRNVIQQQKIEMADEVINAGRFDQQTSHAERRETLEKIMREQEGGPKRSCAAMSMRALNEKLARTPAEVELFNKMDNDETLWPGGLTTANETPYWLRYDVATRDEAVASTAKAPPGRAGDVAEAHRVAAAQLASGVILGRGERSKGGFVPGLYKAQNAALTGADAAAVMQRAAAAEAAAAAAATEGAATAAVEAAAVDVEPATAPPPVQPAAAAVDVDVAAELDEPPVVLADDDDDASEVTEKDDDDDDLDLGVSSRGDEGEGDEINLDDVEEEEWDEDGVGTIGEQIPRGEDDHHVLPTESAMDLTAMDDAAVQAAPPRPALTFRLGGGGGGGGGGEGGEEDKKRKRDEKEEEDGA